MRFVQLIESREKDRQSFWRYTWTKFAAWNQTDFSKLVLMDADSLFFQTADELFEYPELGAVVDHMSGNSGKCDCFHTAMLVLQPNTLTFNQLITFANSKAGKAVMYPGDLGIINEFFMNRWKRVPNVYSYLDEYVSPTTDIPPGIRLVQYSGTKPWNIQQSGLRKSHGKWFTIFNRLLDRKIVPSQYQRLEEMSRKFAA